MNKLLFIGIIIANGITFYYSFYVNISKHDAAGYLTANRIFYYTTEATQKFNEDKADLIKREISRNRLYQQSEVNIDTIQFSYNTILKVIKNIVDDTYNDFWKKYPPFLYQKDSQESLYNLYQQQNRNYNISDSILYTQGRLNQLCQTIAKSQVTIDDEYGETDLGQVWKSRYYLDTTSIKAKLSDISTTQLLLELQMLRHQVTNVAHYWIKGIENSLMPIFDYNHYVPLMNTSADFDKIQLGETSGVKAFIVNYGIPIHDSLVQVNVNGKEIPFSKGIATYTTKASRLGKHKLAVEYIYEHPNTKWKERNERTFEYEVVDCQ